MGQKNTKVFLCKTRSVGCFWRGIPGYFSTQLHGFFLWPVNIEFNTGFLVGFVWADFTEIFLESEASVTLKYRFQMICAWWSLIVSHVYRHLCWTKILFVFIAGFYIIHNCTKIVLRDFYIETLVWHEIRPHLFTPKVLFIPCLYSWSLVVQIVDSEFFTPEHRWKTFPTFVNLQIGCMFFFTPIGAVRFEPILTNIFFKLGRHDLSFFTNYEITLVVAPPEVSELNHGWEKVLSFWGRLVTFWGRAVNLPKCRVFWRFWVWISCLFGVMVLLYFDTFILNPKDFGGRWV